MGHIFWKTKQTFYVLDTHVPPSTTNSEAAFGEFLVRSQIYYRKCPPLVCFHFIPIIARCFFIFKRFFFLLHFSFRFILFYFFKVFFSLPVLYWSSRPAPLEFDSFCWVPFAWVGLALSSVFIHSSPLSCKRNNSYISKKWYFKKDMSFLFLNQLTISWVENERHFSCWNNERPIFDTFLCRVAVSLFVSL